MGSTLGFAPNAGAVAGTPDGDFVPVTPKRLLDTRPTGGGVTHIDPAATLNPTGNLLKAAAGQTTKVKVAGITLDTTPDPDIAVPADAYAVSLTVTGVDSAASDNYLTVWDCSDAIDGTDGVEPDVPLASNLNLVTNDIRANAVVTKVGTSGSDDNMICIFSRRATNLVVDINGYWPTPGEDDPEHLDLLDTPSRRLDTRPESRVAFDGAKPPKDQVITLDLGNTGESAIVNVTGVDGAGGFVTVWNCDDQNPPNDGMGNAFPEPDPPIVSSLNIEPGIIAANLAVVELGANGKACFYTSAATHLVVDLVGTIPTTADFTGLTLPKRVLESRNTNASATPPITQTGTDAKFGSGTKVRLDIDQISGIPAGVTSVILNVTGTQSNDGYVSVYPCADTAATVPNASVLNLKAGQSRAAGVVSKVDANGGVCFFTQNPTHLIADLVGYFVP